MSGGRRDALVALEIVCRDHPDKILFRPVITTTRIVLLDSPKDAPIGISGGPHGPRLRRRCTESVAGRQCRITADFRKDRVDAVLYALYDAMPEPATRTTWRLSESLVEHLVSIPTAAPTVLDTLKAAGLATEDGPH